MTTTYSLKEFYDLVKQLAAQDEKEYISCQVEMSNDKQLVFKGYIETYGYETGKTPEEVLTKFRAKIMPVPTVWAENELTIEAETKEESSNGND
jgi:hypothetical protein